MNCFCSSALIHWRPLRFAEHCRCDWASTGPDRTVGEPAERAWVASARPRASSRKDVLHRMVAKCLRAGGAALRPDHCPAFLPVASRKCFGMLPTSQNRCGVFAGIGSILTGGRQDGHRLAAGLRGCVKITLFRGLSNSTRGTPRWRVLACNTMYYFINHLFYYKTPW